MDFPSFNQLFEIARNEALARSAPLSLQAIEREGSDANIMIASACAAADEVIGQLIVSTAGLFLDSANGDALDRLLFDRYGLTRKVAANAVGTVQFTTTASNPAPFSIPVGVKLSTTTGTAFETVNETLFPAGTTGPVNVTVRSLLAGADQQAKIGTITNITGAVPSAPSDLAVNNAAATAGASDREADSAFRERGRAFFTTVRRGTLSAIEQGALTVPGVTRANAYEILDSAGRPARLVSLVIADNFTDALANYSAVPPVYAEQSSALAESVFTALEDYRPAGTFVAVQMGQVILEPITLSLSFAAGTDAATAANSARGVLVTYINNLDPGEGYTRAQLVQALKGVSGLIITEQDQLNPGNIIKFPEGDRVPTPLQVFRTSLALVRTSGLNSSSP